jgi:hypothetical protein
MRYKFCEFHNNIAKYKILSYKFSHQITLGDAMVGKTDKREKFVRLAEGRTQSALEAIRKIGNLSNKRAYEYRDEDIKKIIRALKEAINDTEKKFETTPESGNKFKL